MDSGSRGRSQVPAAAAQNAGSQRVLRSSSRQPSQTRDHPEPARASSRAPSRPRSNTTSLAPPPTRAKSRTPSLDRSRPSSRNSSPRRENSATRATTPASDGGRRKSYLSSSDYVKQNRDKSKKAAPLTRRYFVTRAVVFCSARNGVPNWEGCPTVPIEFLHATAPVWFHSITATSLQRSLCTAQESLARELMIAYDHFSSRFLGYMDPVVQRIVRNNLCLIFNVIRAARAVDRTKNISIEGEDEHARQVRNEATYRHQWDELFGMLAAYSGSEDVQYQREAKLKYAEAPPPEMTEMKHPNAPPLSKKPVLSSPTEVYVQAYPYRALMSPLERERALWWIDGLRDEGEEKEPLAGVADGILYLTVPDVFSTYDVADAVNIWSPNLELDTKQDEDGRGGGRKKAEKTTVFPGNAFANTDEPPTFSDEDRSAYQQARQLPVWRSPRTAATAEASQTRSSDDEQALLSPDLTEAGGSENVRKRGSKVRTRHLHIPLSANEFKKLLKGWDADAATDQERLYLVSMCTYLRLFGVSRFPVYGLVTSGSEGVISCAWNELVPCAQNNMHQAIFIADEDAVHVDIREPLGALNVATYIAYIIAVHAPRLRQLFQEDAADHPSLQQYLSDRSGPTPRQRARTMRKEDGRWHKPLSQAGLDRRDAELASVQEEPATE